MKKLPAITYDFVRSGVKTMKIRLITMSKVKESFVLSGEQEYLKRLGREARLELIELDAVKGGNLPKGEVMAKEAKALLAKLKSSDYLIVLDALGTHYSSEGFADSIQNLMSTGKSEVSFAIGGAFGWDESVLKRANAKLSLSKLTFPYQMTRLILIEQLYRAFAIIGGRAYHK